MLITIEISFGDEDVQAINTELGHSQGVSGG